MTNRLLGLRLVAALLLTPLAASAQVYVSGTISDSDSSQPLSGATVVFEETSTLARSSTVSDLEGLYVMNPRLEAGAYAVEIRFLGYETLRDTVQVVGRTVEFNYELTASVRDIAEATVQGERAGLIGESAGLQRITPIDLALVPAGGGQGDVAAYLQTVPGVASLGDRGGQLYIRGGTPSETLSQLDGIRLERPFHIVGVFSAFPTEVVRRADVYSGGFPARFGGRSGAVIDATTRPGPDDGLEASATFSTFQSSARISGPVVPGRVSAMVSARESLVASVFPEVVGQNFPYSFGDAVGNLSARLGGTVTLGLTGVRTHDRGEVGTQRVRDNDVTDEFRTDSTRYLIRWENEGVGATLRAGTDTFGGMLRASGSRSRNRQGPDFALRRDGGSEAVEGVAEVFGRRGAFGYRLGAFARQGTLTYSFDDFVTTASADSVEVSEAGGYVELSAHNGPMQVEGGLRVHRYSPANQVSLEPRARLLWERPGGRNQVGIGAASIAAGIFRQGETGLTDSRESGDVFVAYVPVGEGEDLPTSQHLLAAVEGQVGRGFGVSVESFVKTFSDLRVARLSSVLLPSTEFDLASGLAYGGDIRADATRRVGKTRLTGSASYSLQKVEYELDETGERFAAPQDLRHQASFLGKLDVWRFEFQAQWLFGSGLPFTPSRGFDIYLDPDDPDVSPIEGGVPRGLYGERNSRRLPNFHRLDLWVRSRVVRPKYEIDLSVGLLNVYDRRNLFYFDLTEFRRVDQIPLLPVLGLQVRTR